VAELQGSVGGGTGGVKSMTKDNELSQRISPKVAWNLENREGGYSSEAVKEKAEKKRI
jgi:hypothetical protein